MEPWLMHWKIQLKPDRKTNSEQSPLDTAMTRCLWILHKTEEMRGQSLRKCPAAFGASFLIPVQDWSQLRLQKASIQQPIQPQPVLSNPVLLGRFLRWSADSQVSNSEELQVCEQLLKLQAEILSKQSRGGTFVSLFLYRVKMKNQPWSLTRFMQINALIKLDFGLPNDGAHHWKYSIFGCDDLKVEMWWPGCLLQLYHLHCLVDTRSQNELLTKVSDESRAPSRDTQLAVAVWASEVDASRVHIPSWVLSWRRSHNSLEKMNISPGPGAALDSPGRAGKYPVPPNPSPVCPGQNGWMN